MTDLIMCRQLIDFLADYADGTLPADQQREFVRHLEVCPACVRYIDSYKATIEFGKAALRGAADAAPAAVPEELIQAILAARKV
jgi:anti-sigma factor RsiW